MKLKYDQLLSNFAFKCNLRHYVMASMGGGAGMGGGSGPGRRNLDDPLDDDDSDGEGEDPEEDVEVEYPDLEVGEEADISAYKDGGIIKKLLEKGTSRALLHFDTLPVVPAFSA